MNDVEMARFERSLEQIVDLARGFGLDFFDMRYEICPADVLYTFGAYGMPTRFTHWSFGKAYHRMKTQYDFNLSRIYELVINSDPCYAFLLESNSVLQNQVIAAHVLAHSDFFKHNARFAHTSRTMMDTMAINAAQIRDYEFRYGRRRVESFLDAALALHYHIDPYLARNPPPRDHAAAKPKASAERPPDPYEDLRELDRYVDRLGHTATPSSTAPGEGAKARHRRAPRVPTAQRLPIHTDLLLFIAEEARSLEDWERHTLLMVRDEMLYFYPQLETKIMNEGWASFWHARIMRALDLSPEDAVEFAKMHAQVLQPHRMTVNPYRVGYEMFQSIEKQWGTEKMFEVRETESDASFIRNYLTEELVTSLDLYLYGQSEGDWVVTDKDWKALRDQMVRQVTHLGIPRIVVADSDYRGNGELLLVHRYEGEELDQHYVDRTLPYLYRLWRRAVHLETVVGGKTTLVSYDGEIHRRSAE